MLNQKGFITLEAIFYIIISLIMLLMINTLTLQIINYQPNHNIKVFQSLNMLKQSLIRYKEISSYSKKEIILNDYVKIRIKDNQIYETPGYMPYLQGLTNARFIYKNKKLSLRFVYKNKKYESVIFYDK